MPLIKKMLNHKYIASIIHQWIFPSSTMNGNFLPISILIECINKSDGVIFT